jgi:hypothetical protein
MAVGYMIRREEERTTVEEPHETSPLLGSKLPASYASSTTAGVTSQEDEESWLQNPCPADEDALEVLDRSSVLRIILVLLIGGFHSYSKRQISVSVMG